MRRGHFVIIYAIFFLSCILSVLMRQYRNSVAADERARLEDAFLDASDYAAEELALGVSSNLESTLYNVSEKFFDTLCAELSLYRDEDRERETSLYVPVLAVTMEDGFYLCILERAEEGGETLLRRRWTECLPYVYEDADYVYRFSTDGKVLAYHKAMKQNFLTDYGSVKSDAALSAQFAGSAVFADTDSFYKILRASIAGSIEKQVTLALSSQAYLAGDLGCNIAYACPSFLEVLPDDAAGTFFAVYQSLPGVAGTGYSYSGVKAASFVREKTLYFVAEPEDGAYYRLAHREWCPRISGTGTSGIDRGAAVGIYGAYGCPECIRPTEGFMYPPGY